MESLPLPEILPQIPEAVKDEFRRELESHTDYLYAIYGCYRSAQDEKIVPFVIEISDYIESAPGVPDGATGSFERGMLFSILLGDKWLHEPELAEMYDATESISRHLADRAQRDLNYSSDLLKSWGEAALMFGTKALDSIPDFKDFAQDYIESIEPEEELVPYALAGAGLMAQALVVARQLRLKKDIRNFHKRLKTPGFDRAIGKLLAETGRPSNPAEL